MTNKNAIEKLTYARQNADEELDPDWCVALDVAIEALKERTQTHGCDSKLHETHEERTDIEDAIEWIENLRDGWKDKTNIKMCNLAIKALENMLNVNPAKVGHWIEYKYAEELGGHLISNIVCDKCHAGAGADYAYCPNCGVKMEVKNG